MKAYVELTDLEQKLLDFIKEKNIDPNILKNKIGKITLGFYVNSPDGVNQDFSTYSKNIY
jgi:hypothetical protein